MEQRSRILSLLRRLWRLRLSKEELMRRDWDARARENARYYIASKSWKTEQDFDRSGEASVQGILADIEPHLSPDMTVLEIGCGIGRMLKPLARRFRLVHGVDVSEEMIRQARERLSGCPNIRLHVTSGRDLRAISSSSIDLVLSLVVFQHIPSREIIASYLSEVARVLVPEGLFKFQVWGRDDTPAEEERERARAKLVRASTWHGVRFTDAQIRAITERAGLDILTTYTYSGAELPYLWVVSRRPA
jgi:cyclopropane fatty-acyl-phospholipid synthase-like methyltransferase